MNAVLYMYSIDDDPNAYQWGYRAKIVNLIIPDFKCGINDRGECFELDAYQKPSDCNAIPITISEDMEHRLRKTLQMKKRSKILRKLLLEILVASAIQL